MEISNAIIADTSAIVSLLSQTDSNHKRALVIEGLVSQSHHIILIPADVFTETMNVFGRSIGHVKTLAVIDFLFSSETFQMLETTTVTRSLALECFKKQAISVSYTDCIVMATADAFKTKDIFGFDEVFRKNGYQLPSSH